MVQRSLVMALERAFTLRRDVGQDEHGRRPSGNAAANRLSSAWENLTQHPHNRESSSTIYPFQSQPISVVTDMPLRRNRLKPLCLELVPSLRIRLTLISVSRPPSKSERVYNRLLRHLPTQMRFRVSNTCTQPPPEKAANHLPQRPLIQMRPARQGEREPTEMIWPLSNVWRREGMFRQDTILYIKKRHFQAPTALHDRAWWSRRRSPISEGRIGRYVTWETGIFEDICASCTKGTFEGSVSLVWGILIRSCWLDCPSIRQNLCGGTQESIMSLIILTCRERRRLIIWMSQWSQGWKHWQVENVNLGSGMRQINRCSRVSLSEKK